jgi:hypothetical protein
VCLWECRKHICRLGTERAPRSYRSEVTLWPNRVRDPRSHGYRSAVRDVAEALFGASLLFYDASPVKLSSDITRCLPGVPLEAQTCRVQECVVAKARIAE